jgi:hypothetical protein
MSAQQISIADDPISSFCTFYEMAAQRLNSAAVSDGFSSRRKQPLE